MFLTNSFCLKRVYKAQVFIQNLSFTNGPRLGCMGAGRFWQMWYLFISPVDFFYHFICIRSTLISFIIIFPLKSIPQQGSVVPPSAPQDYCGSNDTSRFSITGTIEWFKPFLVLAWASGELNMAYSADPIPVGMIASLTPFRRAGSNVLRTDFFWNVGSACQILSLFFDPLFSVAPSCRFSFQLYPEVCLVWANLTKTVKIIFQLKIKRITKYFWLKLVNIVWLIFFNFMIIIII